MAAIRRSATARNGILDSVKLAHENCADHCDFDHFDRTAVCAGCTARRGQVEGGRAKRRRHHRWRQGKDASGEQMNQAIQVKDKKKFDELGSEATRIGEESGPRIPRVGRVSREGEPPAKRWPGDRIDFRYARCVMSPLSSYRTAAPTKCGKNIVVAC